MIPHTKAFERFRNQSQAHLTFVVLISSAVPNLNAVLNDPSYTLAPQDYFKPSQPDGNRLKTLIGGYQRQLALLSVVALFSYFEEYIKASLREIIDFHGGEKKFLDLSRTRATRFLQLTSPSIKNHKRKLQEYAKLGKSQKYRKHSVELENAGYRFPTELLGPYGAKSIIQKSDTKRGLRAWEIPSVLEDGLLLKLTSVERKRLDEIRKLRNKIAHGTRVKITFTEAMAIARELHELAANINTHIVENFLVLERFA